MNSVDFDVFLAEMCTTPNCIYMHPKIWAGFWSIKRIPKIIKITCRFFGKLLHNRNIFWVGLPLYWVDGVKKYFPEGVNVELVDINE